MKQLFLSLAMLLCAGSMHGQSVEKLMAKYKALPDAKYEDTTEESRKEIEKNKAEGGLNQEDYDFALKHFKKSEQVQLTLDDVQKDELEKDLQALKGYELLFTQNDNKEPEEGKNLLQNMINQTFSTDYKIRVYGKVKGDVVNNLLVRCDIFGKVVLVHNDCKIKKDFMLKSLFSGDAISLSEDADEVTDMKDVVKDVENGHALFVIDGKEHPELHSLKEAQEYMEKNNFYFNQESWVVGGAVKEKYPNTNKKVVIEFSRTEKEEQK